MKVEILETSPRRMNAHAALLDAAQKLFIAKGYEAVSTRELAEEAGVNLGAIQYHFGSKAKLFVEAVSHMMEGQSNVREKLCCSSPIKSKKEAAQFLCQLIESFLNYLLRPQGPQACKLMFREILADASHDSELHEAIVSTMVERFSSPLEEAIVGVLDKLCPEIRLEERHHTCRSIIGQCSFYVTHRPFIERLSGKDFSSSPALEEIVHHICRFSLRGIGCSDSFIDEAVNKSLRNGAHYDSRKA